MVRAQRGDRGALEALLQRCLPSLKRWAHGRLPSAARGSLDTGDIVQEAALNALRRLDTFEPRNVGSMQAYLRQSVINRIRDEVRRIGRNPPHPTARISPAMDVAPEMAIAVEATSASPGATHHAGTAADVAHTDSVVAGGDHAAVWRTDLGNRMAVTRAVERLTSAVARLR